VLEGGQVTHKSNDGGPAHPLPHPSQHIPGISVRDFFAAAALASMLTEPAVKIRNPEDLASVAHGCYLLADAMMAERAK
jgi:hypothetical protein